MASSTLSKIAAVTGAIYSRLPKKVQDEITLYATLVTAVVNVVQVVVIPLPAAAHIAIAVVTTIAAAVQVRQSVTPTSRLPLVPVLAIPTTPVAPPTAPPPAA